MNTRSALLDSGDAQTENGGEPADNFEDALLEFTSCLRDQSLDVGDPDFLGDGPVGGGSFGRDQDDPEVEAALEECQDLLPGNPFQDDE